MRRHLVASLKANYRYIQLACRVDDVHRVSTEDRLSEHDAYILAHLHRSKGKVAARLAEQLGISTSTLGDALRRLRHLGYVQSRSRADDLRSGSLTLTAKGLRALKRSATLDIGKLDELLKSLPAEKHQATLEVLSLLARAARERFEHEYLRTDRRGRAERGSGGPERDLPWESAAE